MGEAEAASHLTRRERRVGGGVTVVVWVGSGRRTVGGCGFSRFQGFFLCWSHGMRAGALLVHVWTLVWLSVLVVLVSGDERDSSALQDLTGKVRCAPVVLARRHTPYTRLCEF